MSIHQVLKRVWGYDEFRPMQEEIIRSVMDGHDTLALLPTGGGKSVCFQVPALFKSGICIVVSPLIALMRDQVETLKSKGVEAIAIISGMGKREVDILLDNCIYGNVKFLYISPERLLSDLVRERIRHMNVNLIAIDEAHCISQWGYDFRPPYLHLSALREIHPQIPVLALTATATDRVADDIQQKLNLRNTRVFRKSFERKNLSYVVFDVENKLRKLLSVVQNVKGTGIVYVRNRRETQEVSRLLNQAGVSADFYHAGLDTSVRAVKQEAWKKGQVRVIVSTNAFGMGIDKADVRFVVHLDLPESLEAYYQEAGRAGRDEKKAFAVLLYNESDILQLERRLEQNYPSVEEIKQIYHHLGNYFQLAYGAGEGLTYPFDVADFCLRFKLEPLKTLQALKFLEKDEYIALTETVFLPSRVKIQVSNEELYRFQISHHEFDFIIKTLLRSYGGLFDHFIPIRETDLAKRLAITKIEVEVVLQRLQSLQILSYLPQTDIPQLQFLKPRVDTQHLLINRAFREERFEVSKKQISSVIAYARLRLCRSIQLLSYFSEMNAAECGVCDVCIENAKKTKQQERMIDDLTAHIVSALKMEALSLEALVKELPGNEKDNLDVIRLLLDAGKIKSDGFKYFL